MSKTAVWKVLNVKMPVSQPTGDARHGICTECALGGPERTSFSVGTQRGSH